MNSLNESLDECKKIDLNNKKYQTTLDQYLTRLKSFEVFIMFYCFVIKKCDTKILPFKLKLNGISFF